MQSQTIVRSVGLRDASGARGHQAGTVGERYTRHRRALWPDGKKIIPGGRPVVDRPARAASAPATFTAPAHDARVTNVT